MQKFTPISLVAEAALTRTARKNSIDWKVQLDQLSKILYEYGPICLETDAALSVLDEHVYVQQFHHSPGHARRRNPPRRLSRDEWSPICPDTKKAESV